MGESHLPAGIVELLRVPVGSRRYGYDTEESDLDVFILSTNVGTTAEDEDGAVRTTYFILEPDRLRAVWGHPIQLGNLTGECTGNEAIISFIRENKHELIYSVPMRTVLFGLEYIAWGERMGVKETIKPAMRTAMILSHFAEEREDPFFLNDAEKALISRARTEDLSTEERAAFYQKRLAQGPLESFMRKKGNKEIVDSFFSILKEESQC